MLASCPPDAIRPLQCRHFAHQFAHRVADDVLLGPAFAPAPHGGEAAWWEQALVGNHYTGRPLHRKAGPAFTTAQIARWCNLLEQSLDETLDAPAAAEAKGHVLNLATLLAYWQLRQPGAAAAGSPYPAALAA